MKIIVLYGIGEVGKRSELLKIKKHFSSDLISEVDLKKDDLKSVQNLILASPLFETGKRLIVVENASSALDLNEQVLSFGNKLNQGNDELYLAVLAPVLKNDSVLFKSAQALKAKLLNFEGEEEVSAFPFLDKLIEGKKEAFLELDKLLEAYNGVYVLSMIFYLLRRNILPPPASVFAKKKIEQQKAKYQTNNWLRLYEKTLETEFKIKNGQISEKLGLVMLTQYFLSEAKRL